MGYSQFLNMVPEVTLVAILIIVLLQTSYHHAIITGRGLIRLYVY